MLQNTSIHPSDEHLDALLLYDVLIFSGREKDPFGDKKQLNLPQECIQAIPNALIES
jgi:hypothetical protein